MSGDDNLTTEQQCRLIEALAFYAEAANWHGVYLIGRGPMADDWSAVKDDQYPDGKPGKMAREALKALIAEPLNGDLNGDERWAGFRAGFDYALGRRI